MCEASLTDRGLIFVNYKKQPVLLMWTCQDIFSRKRAPLKQGPRRSTWCSLEPACQTCTTFCYGGQDAKWAISSPMINISLARLGYIWYQRARLIISSNIIYTNSER
ncbi:unnamed protein product [Calypogeia fissa]